MEWVVTVLAGEVIANINVLTAEAHGPKAAGTDIMFEAKNRGDLKASSDTTNKNLVILNDFDFVLEPENKSLLPADDLHRLVARIEKQGP